MELPQNIKSTFLKTGTTICGVKWAHGIVLGADTRSTSDTTVADKNCFKLHYLADNIWACGAGTAADCDFTTDEVRSRLVLHSYRTSRDPLVTTAVTMFKRNLHKYQGHIGTALVLGGVDRDGIHLCTIWPHGSVDYLPYVTMGSGCVAAMTVLDNEWVPNMTREQAVKLVTKAITSGITNDLGSGSNVDVCVIDDETFKGELTRSIAQPVGDRLYRSPYPLRLPPAHILKETVESILPNIQITETIENL